MSTEETTSGFLGWIDQRFPATRSGTSIWPSTTRRRTSILVLLRVAGDPGAGDEILTGIWLAMSYKPSAADAFARRVHHARRELGLADPLSPLTAPRPSFIVIYLHMFAP